MAARIAQPLTHFPGRVRTPIQRNNPRVMDHLHHDGDVARSLLDLVIVVVKAGHHRRTGGRPKDAAFRQRPILRTIVGMAPIGGANLRRAADRSLRQRRNLAVRWIDNQRSPERRNHLGPPIPPEIVVRLADVRVRALDGGAIVGVVLRDGRLFVSRRFGGREEGFVREILQALERCQRDVGPVTGEIRLAVGRLGRSPVGRSLAERTEGNRGRRQNDQAPAGHYFAAGAPSSPAGFRNSILPSM